MAENRRVPEQISSKEELSTTSESQLAAQRGASSGTRGRSKGRRRNPPREVEVSESRPSVLVVEDNPTTRRVVRLTLEQHGFNVLEAPDGKTALQIMELERPRLVLQDLMLPDIDGLDLVGELRNRTGNTKVSILAFSGFVAKPDETKLKAVGFDDVVSKPIDGSRLISILEAHWLATAPTPERFGAGRRVIVADDDPLQLRVTRLRLERLGFRVRSASNGVQALELAKRIKPDLLIANVMMPRLDGFGLSILLRQEPELRALAIVLVTSNVVTEPDRAHARRSGANRLVQRTPDLKELIQSLRATTIAPEATPIVMPEALLGLEQERSQRLLQQLERQVKANERLARRCSALAAELTVLSGISEAVIRSGDLGVALDEALATCLDAGGLSAGLLYVLGEDGALSVRKLGTPPTWAPEQIHSFFGHESLLRWAMQSARVVQIPSRDLPTDLSIDVLQKSGASNVLLVPLIWRERPLGALVMVTEDRDVDHENWRSFAQGMANHVTQALALIEAFASRERAERTARDQSRLLRAVIDDLNEGVIVADNNGKVLLWNAAAQATSGTKSSDAEGSLLTPPYPLYRDEQLTPFPVEELPLTRALRGETTQDVEIYSVSEQGEGRFLRVSGRPLVVESGQQTGAVVVFRDVTDEKRAEAQLLATERLASVGMVAASIAHEINNPLSAVLANLELALAELETIGRHQPLPGELWEELRDVRGGAERIRQIARDLGLFSRPEEDTKGPVDVRRVLDSTLRLTWNEVRHRARLVKRYERVPPVTANESRLGQVFLNLIVNAAQAIPEGDSESNEIRISTGLDPAGKVLVTVAETRSGANGRPRKTPSTPPLTARSTQMGQGLGLSICRRIITSLGGELAFDREEGFGSVVRVALPAAQPTTA